MRSPSFHFFFEPIDSTAGNLALSSSAMESAMRLLTAILASREPNVAAIPSWTFLGGRRMGSDLIVGRLSRSATDPSLYPWICDAITGEFSQYRMNRKLTL